MSRSSIFVAMAMLASLGAEETPRPTLTAGDITATIAPLVRVDSSIDLQQLEASLRAISDRVTASQVLPQPQLDADAAAGEKPLAGAGDWRLWVFWGMDVPESAGLASELVRVRASGLARIRPVHLASYRHWEAFLFRMNDYREGVLAAAKIQDKARLDTIYRAWSTEVQELKGMTDALYGGPIPITSTTSQAELLQVVQVPSFRLISPGGRVHSLAGFTPGADLVGWVARCQAWEAAADQGGRP